MKNKLTLATMLALGTALISGTNNFLTKIAVTGVKDPILFTTLKNMVVAVLLIGIFLGLKKLSELRTLNRSQWLKLVAIGAIGGSIPFALYFTGLAQTSALNASLIHKTLFLWVAVMAIPLLKEKMTKMQWLGIIAIFSANLMIGGFKGFKFNTGELMILGATIFWAVENIVAKKVLADISSVTVASARMVLGSIMLGIYVLATTGFTGALSMSASNWSWTLLTSLLLTGYVITWYTALKHAPVTYVATLLVPATLVTNVLASIFITHTFTGMQLISSLLFVTGSALVIKFANRSIQPNLAIETR